MGMRQAVIFVGVFTLIFGVAAPAHAQQGQANANAQQKKQKHQPNQVPDSGSGQSEPLAADTTFERAVDNVPVTVRGDGTIVVELNDSFMEAQTASIGADGSVHYDHITGLQRAADFVRRQTPGDSTLLPSRTVRIAFPSNLAFRFYEVK
jgi:hypothetical protein